MGCPLTNLELRVAQSFGLRVEQSLGMRVEWSSDLKSGVERSSKCPLTLMAMCKYYRVLTPSPSREANSSNELTHRACWSLSCQHPPYECCCHCMGQVQAVFQLNLL